MQANVMSVLATSSAPGLPDDHSLAVATLVSWLVAEACDCYLVSGWIGGSSQIRRGWPRAVPRPVIFGHAGLALTGLLGWISFVLTDDVVLAWLSIGFLATAIGLGISTVISWTPFPARRPGSGPASPRYDGILGFTSGEMLVAAIEDEALTARLVDDLVASMLGPPVPATCGPRRQLLPLIPAAHGVLATSTVVFAVLTAVAAS